jgi:hypothetical protein
MTISVSDNDPRQSYTLSQGASSQTAFAVPFEFFADADLNVYVNDVKKTLTTHYTTSANAQNNAVHVSGTTGFIHFTNGNEVNPASADQVVVITRKIALERTTDFPTSGAFNISSLNTELDRVIAVHADVQDTANRGLRLQDSDDAVATGLPLIDARKGKVLAFNSSTGVPEAGPSLASVTTVATQSANINTLAGINADITQVANIHANVTTVAGIHANVTTVAGNTSNINAVAGDASDIGTVANAITNVNNVGNNITNVNAVAGVASDVTAVAGISSNVTTVAGSIADVNTFAVRYRIGSSDPTSSLDEGDLFYNSTSKVMKVYNGSQWIAGVSGYDFTVNTNTWTKAQIPSTYIGTNFTLDFDTYQNFILTLSSGSNSLANPTTESGNIGQTGVIILIQPSSGQAGYLSVGSDYETSLGQGISLSTRVNQYDLIPYVIKAENSILLGNPQRDFS